MKAAVQALRRLRPSRIVAAVPVGAAETCAAMPHEADESICACEPEPFYGVGMWYQDFSETSDNEVKDLLAQAARDFPRRPRMATQR
jgi:putative phosphoribosyl transferase